MSKRNILKYVDLMVKEGVMQKPLWLDAMKRVGVTEARPGKRPPRLDFPEDRLMQVYYQKYPEARLEPVDLTSFEPPTARRFVARQLELMAEGQPRKEAFSAVEAEFLARGDSPGGTAGAFNAASAAGVQPGGAASIIEQVQAEEEEQLNAGLQSYVDRNGPIQVPKLVKRPGFQRNTYSDRLQRLQAMSAALKAPEQPAAAAPAPAAAQGSSSSATAP